MPKPLTPELERLLELAGAHPRTLANWQKGRARPPAAARVLARIIVAGELEPVGGRPWADYRLLRGKLLTPSGESFEPHELDNVRHTRALARSLLEEKQLQLPGMLIRRY
jgi:hypothetical protein